MDPDIDSLYPGLLSVYMMLPNRILRIKIERYIIDYLFIKTNLL